MWRFTLIVAAFISLTFSLNAQLVNIEYEHFEENRIKGNILWGVTDHLVFRHGVGHEFGQGVIGEMTVGYLNYNTKVPVIIEAGFEFTDSYRYKVCLGTNFLIGEAKVVFNHNHFGISISLSPYIFYLKSLTN